MNNQNVLALDDAELAQANGGMIQIIVEVVIAVVGAGVTLGWQLAEADSHNK